MLRPATPSDHAAFARLFPELGLDEAPADAERFRTEYVPTTFVVEEGGAVVGVLYYQVLGVTGYVRIVIVDPSARRRGLGRAMMTEARARFRAAGCTTWCLNAMPTNAPAIGLYESLGMARVHLTHVVRLPWVKLDGCVAPPRARELVPADDARVTDALRVLPGLLADMRAKGRVLVLLEDDAGAIAGAAVFDPTFPGSPTFRVARPDDAVALACALRPYARSGDPWIQIVVEDHAAAAAALVAAGAEPKLVIQHMRGVV